MYEWLFLWIFVSILKAYKNAETRINKGLRDYYKSRNVYILVLSYSAKNAKTRLNSGSFPFMYEKCTNYLILLRIKTARSSSFGYKCAYVFQVVSIFEWPSRRAISWILIPSFTSKEAWVCRKSWILIIGSPASVANSIFLFEIIVSLRQEMPPHTL